jgi:hypothetical protein
MTVEEFCAKLEEAKALAPLASQVRVLELLIAEARRLAAQQENP